MIDGHGHRHGHEDMNMGMHGQGHRGVTVTSYKLQVTSYKLQVTSVTKAGLHKTRLTELVPEMF